MKHLRILAVTGTFALLCLVGAGAAFAAGSTVSVRVEGLKRTLLPATKVTAPSSGSITKGGTPAGTCPATNAAGPLNTATHGRWGGTYTTGLGIDITQILGETHVFSSHGYYWEFFVNNRAASLGVCDQKLRSGDRLLFAPAPAKGTVYPIVLKTPARATAGTPFTVKAYYYPGSSNKTKPIAGVTFMGLSGSTNKSGVATLTGSHSGKLKLVGSDKGYIRSAASTVEVSG